MSMTLPLQLKKKFYKIYGTAVSNKKYRWGINLLEKYDRTYDLPENEIYRVALLYDHLAMKMRNRRRDRARSAKLANNYLNIAEKLYKRILVKNKSYLHANYGIGRVYSIRKDYDTAIKYQVKAYKQMMGLPRSKRGALAIGGLYAMKGDIKNAERWYLREYHSCPKNDFGAALNLFGFYKSQGMDKKALLYAIKTEQLLKREFTKKRYRGLDMNNSGFVKSIRSEIADLKNKMGLPVNK